jgi:acyl carrier protein
VADLEARLADCFAAVFPDLSAEEVPRASLASVAQWDSLATLTLVAVLEQEFGVSVQPGDLEQLTSFELILDYLRSHPGAS